MIDVNRAFSDMISVFEQDIQNLGSDNVYNYLNESIIRGYFFKSVLRQDPSIRIFTERKLTDSLLKLDLGYEDTGVEFKYHRKLLTSSPRPVKTTDFGLFLEACLKLKYKVELKRKYVIYVFDDLYLKGYQEIQAQYQIDILNAGKNIILNPNDSRFKKSITNVYQKYQHLINKDQMSMTVMAGKDSNGFHFYLYEIAT
jgi:hypothetical protein